MNESGFLVEDVLSGKIISGFGGAGGEARLRRLNREGRVNFRSVSGRYLTGFRFGFDFKAKKIILGRFYLHSVNSRSIVLETLKICRFYFFNPPVFFAFLFLLSLTFLAEKAEGKRIWAFFLNLAVIASPLVHELGHYFAAVLFRVPTAFWIFGPAVHLLFQTRKRVEIIFISLSGGLANLFLLAVILTLPGRSFDGYFRVLILLAVALQIVMASAVLPCFRDGKNIIQSLHLKKGEG